MENTNLPLALVFAAERSRANSRDWRTGMARGADAAWTESVETLRKPTRGLREPACKRFGGSSPASRFLRQRSL